MKVVIRILVLFAVSLFLVAAATWAYTGYFAWRTELRFSCKSGEELVDAYWTSNEVCRVLTSRNLLSFRHGSDSPNSEALPLSASKPLGMAHDANFCAIMYSDGVILIYSNGTFEKFMLLSGKTPQYWDVFYSSDGGAYCVWMSSIEGELKIANLKTKEVGAYNLGKGNVADSVDMIDGEIHVAILGSDTQYVLSNNTMATKSAPDDVKVKAGFRKIQDNFRGDKTAYSRGYLDDTVFINDKSGKQIGRIYVSVPILKWSFPPDCQRICILQANHSLVVKRPWLNLQ